MENFSILLDAFKNYASKEHKNVKIELPAIVMVGDQGSGKSSLVEYFIQRNIFPTGKRGKSNKPVIINLFQSYNDAEFGEFSHIPNLKFMDFEQIQDEIYRLNNPSNDSFFQQSSASINLRLFSPKFLNLTIIDLPGLVQIAMEDQPYFMEDHTKDIVMSYISNPNTIILAVIPAIIDISTSEALKVVQKVDPKFERTLGVLTKVDLMDKGTNCMKTLLNKVIPLDLGWVAIINRSFNDFNDGRPFEEVYKLEDRFFQNHPLYKRLPKKCGIQNLRRIVFEALISRVKRSFPTLRTNIHNEMKYCDNEIEKISQIIPFQNGYEEANFVIQSSIKFTNRIRENCGLSSEFLKLDKISIGVQIQNVLAGFFLHESKKQLDRSIDDDIVIGLSNVSGLAHCVEIPDSIVRSLIRNNISLICPCAIETVRLVNKKLQECIYESIYHDHPFTNLNQALLDFSLSFIFDATEKVKEAILFFIKCEHDHINFEHPDFIKSLNIEALKF